MDYLMAAYLILQVSIFTVSIFTQTTSMNSHYEKVYGVGLLDDIHNYFPLILYEPERFLTIQDLLGYIRQTTRTRFNLYDVGRRQYGIPQNTFVTPRHVPQAEVEVTMSDMTFLLPLLRSVGSPRERTARNFTSLFQDVIVSASHDLVNNASTVRIPTQDLEDSCAICQDRMRQGQNIRKLNTCQHEFHGECIDNWLLERSVLCPVCRHDIRSAPATPVAQPTPATPATQADEPRNIPSYRFRQR